MKKIAAVVMLLLTTFFWGLTFTIVKDAVAKVDVFVFLAQRFVIAFLLLLVICLVRGGKLSRTTLLHGMSMGLFLFSAYAFQTVALLSTTASNTGFLTGMNVVFVPLIGLLWFRQAIPLNLLVAVICAVIGLFLLCTNGSWQFNRGDILALICAVCVALHLLLTSFYARKEGSDVYWLTAIQIGTVGLLSLLFSLARGEAVLQYHPEISWALILCALCATVFAFLVQTSLQRFISPANTALIFCTEPVFAAIYAWYAAGERLGVIGFSGAVLIMAGMLVSELFPKGQDSAIVPSSVAFVDEHIGEL
jgi:drug/metabolite transporter (DMT)-like permease